MAFTGRLGTQDSQLGNLELGSSGEDTGERSTTESASISESAARSTLLFRTATESPSTSESASAQRVVARSATDSPTTSESATRSVVLFRTTSESPATSDTATGPPSEFTGRLGHVLAQPGNFVLGDDNPDDTGPATIDRTATESATASDSATRQLVTSRSTTDAPTTSESATAGRAISRTASDAPTTSESASRTDGAVRSTTDAPTTSDSASQSIENANNVPRSTSDDPTTSESLERQLVGSRVASDAPTISESVARSTSLSRTATDAATTSESAIGARTVSRTATESVTASDSATRVRGHFRTVSDAAGGSFSYDLDFNSGVPAGWSNDSFTETGGAIVCEPGGFGELDLTASGGGQFGTTTMQVDFLTPDPIDDDYWFFELRARGEYVFVDNWLSGPSPGGVYGLYGFSNAVDGAVAIPDLEPATWYTLKAVTSSGHNQAKVWLRSDPEPSSWQLDCSSFPFAGFPIGIDALVDGAGTLTLDNASWDINLSLPDTISRMLAATRQPTETLTGEDWIVHNATEDTVVYGPVPDGYQPVLAAPIDSSQTTITVTEPPPEGYELPWLVYIDGEYVLVTAISLDGLTWTVVRAQNGSIGSSHVSNQMVLPANATFSVGGVQVGADVNFERTRLTTYVNGRPGTGEIWVRDLDRTHSFTTGTEVVVRFRNVRVWGGYITGVRRAYAFPGGSGDISTEMRYLVLLVADYNILFQKRIYFRKTDPTFMPVRRWANGTTDEVVIGNVINFYLDLSGDGLSFDINHVGTPAVPTDSCNPDAPDNFQIGSAGWTWGQVMNEIVSQTGAVYYIDADRVMRYVDDSVKQSVFGYTGLSDNPGGSVIGYRDFELVHDGSQLINQQYTWGVGQGVTAPVLGYADDATSISTHGLWQGGELRYDLYCQDSVDLRAETWVSGSPQNHRGHKNDKRSVRATVFTPYFRPADVISVESETFGTNENIPVRGAEITFPTPWDIKMVLTISHEIDAPWNTFEFAFPELDFHLDIPDFPFPPFPVDNPCVGDKVIDFLMKLRIIRTGDSHLTGSGGNRLTPASGTQMWLSTYDTSTTDTFNASDLTIDYPEQIGIKVARFDPTLVPDDIEYSGGFYVTNDPADVYASFGWNKGSSFQLLDGAAGSWIWLKGQVTQSGTDGSGVIRSKAWVDGGSEPASWNSEVDKGAVDVSNFMKLTSALMVSDQSPANPGTVELSVIASSPTPTLFTHNYQRVEIEVLQLNARTDEFDREELPGWGWSALNGNQSPWQDNINYPSGQRSLVTADVGVLEMDQDWVIADGSVSPGFYTRNGILQLASGDSPFDIQYGCDPCVDAGFVGGGDCCDTFSRTVSPGWGTSEIINPATGTPFVWSGTATNTSVNGSVAVLGRATSQTITLPVEITNDAYEMQANVILRGVADSSGILQGSVSMRLTNASPSLLGSVSVFFRNLDGLNRVTAAVETQGTGWNNTTTIELDPPLGALAQGTEIQRPTQLNIRVEPGVLFRGKVDGQTVDYAAPPAAIRVFGFTRLGAAQWIDEVCIIDGTSCGCGAVPDSSFADPSEQPQYGRSPESGVELDNGNFLYCFGIQYQPGSSEVWADGMRLRVNDDYIEHALEGCIEVLSTATAGTTPFDSSMVILANFEPWLIQDPPPEFVP